MNRPVAQDEAPDPIEAAALRYFAKERSGDPSVQADLEYWLEADPRHRGAYENLRGLWSGLDPYRSEPALLAIREEALDALHRRRKVRGALLGLAASIALVISAATTWVVVRPDLDPAASEAVTERRLATRVGKMQTVVLADGSTAILDTASAISVRIGATGVRKVEVMRGRALFEVAKHPGRPFLVHVGRVAVTAVGTKFDVHRTPNGVVVNLVEGRLRVGESSESGQTAVPEAAGVEMAAGDQLQVRDDSWLLARGAVGRSTEWIGGQLVFEQAPVSEIVAELNRYTDRKLVLGDDEVGNQRVSAVIKADSPLTFLSALETMGVAKVREIPSGYVVESANR